MMEVKLLNLPFQNIQLNFSSNFCADYKLHLCELCLISFKVYACTHRFFLNKKLIFNILIIKY